MDTLKNYFPDTAVIVVFGKNWTLTGVTGVRE